LSIASFGKSFVNGVSAFYDKGKDLSKDIYSGGKQIVNSAVSSYN
jgi:hypothetical protein